MSQHDPRDKLWSCQHHASRNLEEGTSLPGKKDALKLAVCANTISVSGTVWTVDDEDELARLVGRILLGHALHVEKILQKLKPKRKTVDGHAAKEAKAKLIVEKGKDPWHRDGLLFQAISWIAAHQASDGKTSS